MSATNPSTVRIQSQHDEDLFSKVRGVAGNPGTAEPFVSAQEAAKFVGISRRFLTDLARRGIGGAYPIGTGQLRKTWVFRLSELAAAIDHKESSGSRRPPECVRAYHPIIRRSLLK